MTHDPVCNVKPSDQLAAEKCWRCGLIAKARADEREQAAQRVLDAPEHNVKIKGIICAVIQRSVAAAVAGGEA